LVAGTAGSYSLVAKEPVPSITLGGTRRGRLRSTSSTMSYRFNVPRSGFVAMMQNKVGTSLDPKLFLRTSSGGSIAEDDDGGIGNNARIVRYLRAGSYQLVAGAYSGSGSFELSAEELRAPDRLTLNRPITASLTPARPDRAYSLALSSRQTVTITMDRNGTGIDPKIDLYSSTGNRIETDDDGGGDMNSRISRTLSAGTYYVLAYEMGRNGTGSFAIAARTEAGSSRSVPSTRSGGSPAGAASLIGVGDTRTGSLASTTGEVTYRLILDGRRSVQIDVRAASGSRLDPKVTLRNASGSDLAVDDDGGDGTDARLVLVLDEGVYILAVTGVGSTTGRYNMEVSARSMPQRIRVGASHTGRIATSSQRDMFLLQVVRRGSVTISVEDYGGDLDSYLTIMDTAGRTVESNDDGGNGNDARIRRTLDPGGYLLVVRSFGSSTGRYRLLVR